MSGSTVTFSNVSLGNIFSDIGAKITFTVTNIKVSVAGSSLAAGSTITAAVQTINGTQNAAVSNGIIATAAIVGFVQNGLGPVKTTGAGGTGSAPANQICTTISAGAANYQISIPEGFVGAFRTRGSNATNNTLGYWLTWATETGFYSAQTANFSGQNNIATSGTRLKLVFGNIPSGVSVYLPVTVVGTNNLVMQMTTAETGPFTLASVSTAPTGSGLPAGQALLSVSNGSATAIYEITTVDSLQVGAFAVNVTLYTTAAIAAPSGAITTAVSLAPQAATSNVPNFSSTTDVINVNGATFTACGSTLLFPYVTNTLGFDTGIAIANASSDLLTTKNNAPASVATAQSGSCALGFFGTGVPTTNPVTTALVATGQSYISTVSAIAPGFQGYMIASCSFLYAHGFAYIAYGLTTPNGAAMGYLADVILGNRQSTVPTLTATFGTTPAVGTASGSLTALSFGATSTVGSNTPEQGAQ